MQRFKPRHRLSLPLLGLVACASLPVRAAGPATQPTAPALHGDAPSSVTDAAHTLIGPTTAQSAETAPAGPNGPGFGGPGAGTAGIGGPGMDGGPGRGRGGGNRGRRNNNGQPGGPGGFGGFRQFTQEEVDQAKPKALDFMKENSPERYKELQTLEGDPQRRMEEFTTRLYLGMLRSTESSPELYDLAVKRVRVEDTIFAETRELHKDKKAGVDTKDVEARLRKSVAQLVDVNFKERQLRLDRLRKTIDEQQAMLTKEQDPAGRDKLIDDRVNSFIGDSQDMFPPGLKHDH